MDDRIVLNEVAIDWLTLTAFDDRIRKNLRGVAEASFDRQKVAYGTWLGYVGLTDGSIFCGEQEIGGKMHMVFRASGLSADKVVRQHASRVGDSRCTRLDLQLTVSMDDQDSFLDSLVGHAKEQGMAHAVYVSNTKTVYLYSRKSRKFLRVYQKPPYLRIEFELKDTYAQSYLRAITRDKRQVGNERHQVFACLVDAVGHPGLSSLVSGVERLKPKYEKLPNRTDDWLLNSVLKTFASRASQNDELLTAFKEVIERLEAAKRHEAGLTIAIAQDDEGMSVPLPFRKTGHGIASTGA